MPQITRKKINSKPEKDLLTGLITSDKFIREISPIIDVNLLKASYSRTTARWCLDYFKKYEKAPKKIIQEIFNSKRKGNEDENDFLIIEKFLEELSEQFENLDHFNEKFILDQSEKYIAERKLENLSSNITGLLLENKLNDAELTVAEHTRTKRMSGTSIDILNNKSAIINALDEERNELFKMPKVLGELFGTIERGDFISFLAPMKRGKSWWLFYMAIRAALSQLKVLVISLEMPQNEVVSKLMQGILAKPLRDKEITLPYFDEILDSDKFGIKYKTKNYKKISIKEAFKKTESMNKFLRGGGIKLFTAPTNSLTVDDIKTEIYNLLHYENFAVDVIVIDYADILKMENRDYRHGLDLIWKGLRALALEINGLVVTATQGNRATFQKDADEDSVAEDIRKMAHVTQMIALNQTPEEKKKQIMRLSVIASRKNEFHKGDEVLALYNYGIGKPFLDGKRKTDVLLKK